LEQRDLEIQFSFLFNLHGKDWL